MRRLVGLVFALARTACTAQPTTDPVTAGELANVLTVNDHTVANGSCVGAC